VAAFVDEPARAMAEADLVVCRSGAATLAELAVVGRASLLVPFPHATGDHQRHNAEEVASAGAAVCVPQDLATVSRLAFEIDRLLADSRLRTSMAESAARRGRPHAAMEIASDLLGLAGIDTGKGPADAAEATANERKSVPIRERGVA
jgi:UDP-N-acetylglucosamine--N-acetylmuramyl-(pentapeptide) pyrophosphoryl-undecaprenol N-acetylglucosamine transferase